MAHFWGQVTGNRRSVSTVATKSHGINGVVQGNDIGIEVQIEHDDFNEQDWVTVYLNGGRNDKHGMFRQMIWTNDPHHRDSDAYHPYETTMLV